MQWCTLESSTAAEMGMQSGDSLARREKMVASTEFFNESVCESEEAVGAYGLDLTWRGELNLNHWM
ncbi:hypothetical protein TSUD_15700 [Trifolium subterraneum]|uniref:Uncharacterized protein n=1 Tax=Trifolium subterraneum TaxID=3900 RepID=A0A2Z6MDX3_TRISU|nr:hypothetical protein TSUD_15700 [Trifolium subterraneum]